MSFQALFIPESPWALRSLDIKLSVFGWGAYMCALVIYCTLYKVVVESGQPDFAGSLMWSLKFWAIWPPLTLAALVVLRRHENGQRKPLSLVQLGVVVLVVAMVLRVLIDLMSDPQNIGSGIVLSLPRYLAAIVVIALIWYLCLRNKKEVQVAKESSADSVILALPTYPDTLLVTRGSDDCLIRVDAITCICAAGNYVEVYCGQQTYLMRATMKQVEEKLPPGKFIRIHRSHIVKLDDVERIKTQSSGNGTLKLRCGKELRISKKYKSQLQKYRLQAA
jgi:hypothetical protein